MEFKPGMLQNKMQITFSNMIFDKSNINHDIQDTVVLGKNARHSFGRAQDRIPLPTRETGHRINRNAKQRIGNDTRTQAHERPVTRGPVFFGMDSIRSS